MARPQHKQETKPFEISVPITLYEFLGYLAAHSHFGASEGAVAVYLLTKQIDEMIRTGAHNLQLPRAPSSPGD